MLNSEREKLKLLLDTINKYKILYTKTDKQFDKKIDITPIRILKEKKVEKIKKEKKDDIMILFLKTVGKYNDTSLSTSCTRIMFWCCGSWNL